MSQFIDLPSEVQTEIFTFLSLKHLGKILSINKSTTEQINSSELFWISLVNNYSKHTESTLTPGANQKPFNLLDIKKDLIVLIEKKRNVLQSLEVESLKLFYMSKEIDQMFLEMKARLEMEMKFANSPILSTQTNRLEIMEEKSNQVKQKMSEIKKRIEAQYID